MLSEPSNVINFNSLSVGRKEKQSRSKRESLSLQSTNFMTTPDFSFDGRFQRFQKSPKHLRTVTQGIRQTAELERAIEVALVRYSRRGQNGLLNYPMIDKRFSL